MNSTKILRSTHQRVDDVIAVWSTELHETDNAQERALGMVFEVDGDDGTGVEIANAFKEGGYV